MSNVPIVGSMFGGGSGGSAGAQAPIQFTQQPMMGNNMHPWFNMMQYMYGPGQFGGQYNPYGQVGYSPYRRRGDAGGQSRGFGGGNNSAGGNSGGGNAGMGGGSGHGGSL